MYSGSLGSVSNRADWPFQFGFIDENNVGVSVAGATIKVSVTDQDAPTNAIISGSTADVVTVSGDGLTVSWNFPATTMGKLASGTFAVFATMVLAGVTTQIFANATISIVEGGPI